MCAIDSEMKNCPELSCANNISRNMLICWLVEGDNSDPHNSWKSDTWRILYCLMRNLHSNYIIVATRICTLDYWLVIRRVRSSNRGYLYNLLSRSWFILPWSVVLIRLHACKLLVLVTCRVSKSFQSLDTKRTCLYRLTWQPYWYFMKWKRHQMVLFI